MEKRFISTSTHILDPANPSTPPVRPSPPPELDPLAPDPNDKRTLFDKLAASKAQKQEAFEEAFKFSNLIKRLDDKESDFLTNLQSEQFKEEQEKKRLEGEQLDAFKKAQSQIDVVRPSTQDIAPPPPPTLVKRRTSSSVKGVLVKRKSESQGGESKRRRSSVTESPRIESPSVASKSPTPAIPLNSSPPTNPSPKVVATSSSPNISASKNGTQGGLSAFAHYSDSEDSE